MILEGLGNVGLPLTGLNPHDDDLAELVGSYFEQKGVYKKIYYAEFIEKRSFNLSMSFNRHVLLHQSHKQGYQHM